MRPGRKLNLSFVYFVITCLLLSGGCGPTYTSEDFLDGIVKLCKGEYGIDVKVKQAGRTVGVYLPVEGLFQTKTKLDKDSKPEDILSDIRFKKESADKIDHVSLAISRVALSAQAPVDFYVLITTDKDTGLQIVITRYMLDIKRLMVGDVSRGDYFKRLLMNVEFDPSIFAQETVRSLFYDMQYDRPSAIIRRYFSGGPLLRQFSSAFFLSLTELDFKDRKVFLVEEAKPKRISRNKILVYCKVKEAYVPKAGYEDFNFQYPSGFENEYLAVVDSAYLPYSIEQIVPLLTVDKNGQVKQSRYPEEFAKYGQPKVWSEEDFYLEEIELEDFLARQLAGRIRNLYQLDNRFKKDFTLHFVKCEYRRAQEVFSIVLDLEISQEKGKLELELDDIWKIVCEVMRRYEFEGFKGVEVTNILKGQREYLTRQQIMEQYWPRWLRRKKTKDKGLMNDLLGDIQP